VIYYWKPDILISCLSCTQGDLTCLILPSLFFNDCQSLSNHKQCTLVITCKEARAVAPRTRPWSKTLAGLKHRFSSEIMLATIVSFALEIMELWSRSKLSRSQRNQSTRLLVHGLGDAGDVWFLYYTFKIMIGFDVHEVTIVGACLLRDRQRTHCQYSIMMGALVISKDGQWVLRI
jgi:hypothetical protein